jgi:hypothetical protein
MEKTIKGFLAQRGVGIIGVAGIHPLSSVPEEFSPQAVLAAAKTVICYAVPIPKGGVYADSHSLDLYWGSLLALLQDGLPIPGHHDLIAAFLPRGRNKRSGGHSDR